jgi:hypothetical protein
MAIVTSSLDMRKLKLHCRSKRQRLLKNFRTLLRNPESSSRSPGEASQNRGLSGVAEGPLSINHPRLGIHDAYLKAWYRLS